MTVTKKNGKTIRLGCNLLPIKLILSWINEKKIIDVLQKRLWKFNIRRSYNCEQNVEIVNIIITWKKYYSYPFDWDCLHMRQWNLLSIRGVILELFETYWVLLELFEKLLNKSTDLSDLSSSLTLNCSLGNLPLKTITFIFMVFINEISSLIPIFRRPSWPNCWEIVCRKVFV